MTIQNIDPNTGQPIQPVILTDTPFIQPTDIQNHLTSTIQTHNAVSVPLSNGSYGTNSTFYSCDGFNNISVILKNDAATSSTVSIDWSYDNSAIAWNELVKSDSNASKGGIVDVKAPYFRVFAYNGDAAAAHTMSAWAYLKA